MRWSGRSPVRHMLDLCRGAAPGEDGGQMPTASWNADRIDSCELSARQRVALKVRGESRGVVERDGDERTVPRPDLEPCAAVGDDPLIADTPNAVAPAEELTQGLHIHDPHRFDFRHRDRQPGPAEQ